MSILAVVFDFDGTLIDSMGLVYSSFQDAVERATGRRPSRGEISRHFGFPEPEIIRRLVAPLPAEAAIQDFHQTYEDRHGAEVEVFPGIYRLFGQLLSSGRRLALVTGKCRRSTEFSLHAAGLGGRFGTVVTGDDIEHPKPHPEGLLRAIEALCIHPGAALYVGDAEADLKMGVAAGVQTALAGWNPETEQITGESLLRFSTPPELLRWLARPDVDVGSSLSGGSGRP